MPLQLAAAWPQRSTRSVAHVIWVTPEQSDEAERWMVWTIITKGSLNNFTSPFEVRYRGALGSNPPHVTNQSVNPTPGCRSLAWDDCDHLHLELCSSRCFCCIFICMLRNVSSASIRLFISLTSLLYCVWSPAGSPEARVRHFSDFLKHQVHFRESTYSDEGLVEAVEAQVPDEPPADERGNKPEVEVGDHQERSATHHPKDVKHVRWEHKKD